MSDESDSALVSEMLDAARRIAAYIDAGGAPEFLQQTIVYDAVCMNLLRLGECARFLGPETRSRLPTVPWPDLVNLRNRLAHGYETLKPALLWSIASVNVPDVAALLAGLADPSEGGT